MMHFSANPDPAPGPGELVAYVDGTLDPRACGRVTSWLAAHPEVAAELDDHRIVMEAARLAPIPEPTEADWVTALARITAALPACRPAAPRGGARARLLVRATAAAAAVLLLSLPGERVPRPLLGLAAMDPAPLQVASADDVEIISIDAADLPGLLVGHPPVREPLVLAVAGDVELHHAEAGQASWVPTMADGEGETPMIVMPMRASRGDRP